MGKSESREKRQVREGQGDGWSLPGALQQSSPALGSLYTVRGGSSAGWEFMLGQGDLQEPTHHNTKIVEEMGMGVVAFTICVVPLGLIIR